MIVHNLNSLPKERNYSLYITKDSEFEIPDFLLQEFEDLGIHEMWYWYINAGHEGTGQVLMRKDVLYDIHDCTHGSNSLPTKFLEFSPKTLSELKNSLSDDYFKDYQELFELAERKNI